jgi:hypothetical protein
MAVKLSKPAPKFGPGAGLVRHDLFQICHATNDMARGRAIFAEQFGVREFSKIEGPTPEGGHVHMEIGWAAGVMYELICGTGPGMEVFRTGLPETGFAMRFHHLGYFVPSAEAWDAIHQEIARSGRKIAKETDIPGFLKAIVVEAPELGHYLEYILPEEGGVAFFDNAPNN